MIITESELKVADRIARERHQSNRDSGVSDQKIGPQSGYDTDYNGIIGELAVAKRLNIYPDLAIEPGSGGIDLRLGNITLDTKATEYTNGKLLAPIWKQHKDHADAFVLVTIDWPDEEAVADVDIVGWLQAEELFSDENVINLGHGPTFGVEQSELLPITTLISNGQ